MNIRKYIFALASFSFLSNTSILLAGEKDAQIQDKNKQSDNFSASKDDEDENCSSLSRIENLLSGFPIPSEHDDEEDAKKNILEKIKYLLDNESNNTMIDNIYSDIENEIVCQFSLSDYLNKSLFDILPDEYKVKFIIDQINEDEPCLSYETRKKFISYILMYLNKSNNVLHDSICSSINKEIIYNISFNKTFNELSFDILPKNVKQESIIRIVSQIDKNTIENMTRKGAITIFESLITSKYMNQRAYTGIEGLLRELKNVNNNELNEKEVGWINDTLNYVNDIYRIKVIHKN